MIDLTGDRDIEWGYVAAHLPNGPGEALDFGCRDTNLGLIAAMKGFFTTSIDLENHNFTWQHALRRFIQCDLFKCAYPDNEFDLVINCSTIEHVGLSGRYGVESDLIDGDITAMRELHRIMTPGGIQILTLPVGQDTTFAPLHRVYGDERLPILLEGYTREHSEYWQKDVKGYWDRCSASKALSFKAEWSDERRIYAIGCFTLRCEKQR